jgi:hypothetical protein
VLISRARPLSASTRKRVTEVILELVRNHGSILEHLGHRWMALLRAFLPDVRVPYLSSELQLLLDVGYEPRVIHVLILVCLSALHPAVTLERSGYEFPELSLSARHSDDPGCRTHAARVHHADRLEGPRSRA